MQSFLNTPTFPRVAKSQKATAPPILSLFSIHCRNIITQKCLYIICNTILLCIKLKRESFINSQFPADNHDTYWKQNKRDIWPAGVFRFTVRQTAMLRQNQCLQHFQTWKHRHHTARKNINNSQPRLLPILQRRLKGGNEKTTIILKCIHKRAHLFICIKENGNLCPFSFLFYI